MITDTYSNSIDHTAVNLAAQHAGVAAANAAAARFWCGFDAHAAEVFCGVAVNRDALDADARRGYDAACRAEDDVINDEIAAGEYAAVRESMGAW